MFTLAYLIREIGRMISKIGDSISDFGFWLDPELRQADKDTSGVIDYDYDLPS